MVSLSNIAIMFLLASSQQSPHRVKVVDKVEDAGLGEDDGGDDHGHPGRPRVHHRLHGGGHRRLDHVSHHGHHHVLVLAGGHADLLAGLVLMDVPHTAIGGHAIQGRC